MTSSQYRRVNKVQYPLVMVTIGTMFLMQFLNAISIGFTVRAII